MHDLAILLKSAAGEAMMAIAYWLKVWKVSNVHDTYYWFSILLSDLINLREYSVLYQFNQNLPKRPTVVMEAL